MGVSFGDHTPVFVYRIHPGAIHGGHPSRSQGTGTCNRALGTYHRLSQGTSVCTSRYLTQAGQFDLIYTLEGSRRLQLETMLRRRYAILVVAKHTQGDPVGQDPSVGSSPPGFGGTSAVNL